MLAVLGIPHETKPPCLVFRSAVLVGIVGQRLALLLGVVALDANVFHDDPRERS